MSMSTFSIDSNDLSMYRDSSSGDFSIVEVRRQSSSSNQTNTDELDDLFQNESQKRFICCVSISVDSSWASAVCNSHYESYVDESGRKSRLDWNSSDQDNKWFSFQDVVITSYFNL